MPESNKVDNIVKLALSKLTSAGYSEETVNGFRQKYDGLLVYCTENKIEQYTEDVGIQYLEHIAQTRTFSTKAASQAFSRGVARLDCVLNDSRWKPARRELMPFQESIFNGVVKEYAQYLKEKKASDSRFKATVVARFLRQIELLGCIDLKDLNAKIIYDVFTGGEINAEYFGRHIKPFCVYAHTYGLTSNNLASTVPSRKRHTGVPSVYTPEEVERVLASVDKKATNGKRNYAVILIAARLGLRAGDIAKLKLENINFSDSTIKIVQSKTYKPLKLHMSDELKSALQDHLETSNPETTEGFVFQKQFGTGTLTGTAVSSIVHTAFLRAAIDSTNKKSSSHALRASLATALLNEGNDYATIRDVLGHRNIQTAKSYVKTEIEKLRNNAIPVPPMSGSFAVQLSGAGVSV